MTVIHLQHEPKSAELKFNIIIHQKQKDNFINKENKAEWTSRWPTINCPPEDTVRRESEALGQKEQKEQKEQTP